MQEPEAAPAVYALRFGRSLFPKRHLFYGETSTESVDFVWSFFALRYSHQTILVDTGFRNSALAAEWGVVPFHDCLDLLARIGIGSGDVDVVVMTHTHFDHIDNLDLFPRARIFIQAEERLDYLKKGPSAAIRGVLKDTSRTQTFDVSAEVRPGLRVEYVGGHSIGSSAVYFTINGADFVIPGDDCYTLANVREVRPVGAIYNLEKNSAFVKQLAQKATITVLPFHEPKLYELYPAVAGPDIVQIV